ncbi:MAG TPA: tRNA pseudouridine(55) synthase TruB [Armatimonadota bacterium]
MGILNICKVPGMSSHAVVATVRRIIGVKRVGHTGTLDPSACGVLVICLERATKLADYIATGPKTYRAEFTFGVSTDSVDVEGAVTRVVDASHLRESEVIAAIHPLTGSILQRPPAHSAVQVGGRRSYDMVRRGEEVELPLREVTVFAFTPVHFQPGRHPRLLVDITCSKGTYIRSLARDLGEALAVGATMTFLARTEVGGCRLDAAITLEELAALGTVGEAASVLQSPDAALRYLPAWDLPSTTPAHWHGTALPDAVSPGLYRVYQQRRFLGLGRCEDGTLRSVVNLFPL